MTKTNMTLKTLEAALKLPDKLPDCLKRIEAIREFRRTEFGIEALPLLEKALGDGDISVVVIAIECIGELGPKALMGESADMNSPKGLVAKLFSLGNHVWGYSGYKNCYSTCLNTLLQLGYTNKFLLDYIKENLDLEMADDFIDSLKALKAIGSPEARELLKSAAVSRLPELNKGDAKKVQAILAKLGLLQEVELPRKAMQDWHPFHTLTVKAGKLWVGDPHLPNAEDGCIVKVPSGEYVVECDGLPPLCKAVSKLRVRLESAKRPRRGKKLGEAGTDSATIGVCEIAAFEAAYKKKGGAEQVQKAIESQTEGFGVLTVPKFPDAIMPFVPTGGDGNGPVFALMSGTKCVGIDLPFTDE
jgi:hypothetical protein